MLFFLRTLFLLLTFVCSLSAYAVAEPVVLFDESHAQQFLVGRTGPLDLSDLAALYQANGITITSHADGLTEETLAGVDVLIVSGPFKPLSESEMDVVIDFIRAGGGLAVMLHIAPPVRDLLQLLDVDYTNGTLRETRQVIDGNPLNFRINALADHPVTKGLKSFSVYGAWALRGTAPHTMILAASSPRGWVDLDRDGQFSGRDAAQQFGVMVAGEMGAGRYVVIGDDAVFQNRFLDEPNRKLALQLIEWLSPR